MKTIILIAIIGCFAFGCHFSANEELKGPCMSGDLEFCSNTIEMPTISKEVPDGCWTGILECCDGSMHTVMVCDEDDTWAWVQILCSNCFFD